VQAARKEEVFSMESEQTKIEGRLDRIEVSVTGLETHVARVSVDLAETKCKVQEVERRVIETHSDVKELRTRMEDGFQSVRKEISDAKIWALLIAASMLGVLARGFHWI
jgi:hypothetical protein